MRNEPKMVVKVTVSLLVVSYAQLATSASPQMLSLSLLGMIMDNLSVELGSRHSATCTHSTMTIILV